MQCLIEDSVTSHLTVDFEKLQVFNQGSGDLIASAVQPESAVEQISNNSSLSSSPKSVLPEKVPVDQVSSWSFNPEVHVTVQQTDMEDNSLHELLPQNFSLTMPPNAQHLMEDSVAHSSNNSDYEGQQVSKYLSVSLSHTHTHTSLFRFFGFCFIWSTNIRTYGCTSFWIGTIQSFRENFRSQHKLQHQ